MMTGSPPGIGQDEPVAEEAGPSLSLAGEGIEGPAAAAAPSAGVEADREE